MIERKKRSILMEKMMSRKFQVWLIWSIITFMSFNANDLPKETIFTYYGLVSLIYIGGNVASKFVSIKDKKSDIPEGKNE